MKISCNVIRDLLPLYVDDAASEESAHLVQEHLNTCPYCREELRKMRTPISVPPEEDQELWARFEARRQKERRKKRTAVICAGAVLAAILAAFGWYTRPRD